MNCQIKNFSLAIIVSFVALLTSCQNDDSGSEGNGPLVGKWKWTINERLNCGQDEGFFDVYNCNDYCLEIELMADGKLNSIVRDENGEQLYKGSYVYSENKLKMCVLENGDESCSEGEITIHEDIFQMFIPKESADVCDVIRHFEKMK